MDSAELSLYGDVNREGLRCRVWSNQEVYGLVKKDKLPRCDFLHILMQGCMKDDRKVETVQVIIQNYTVVFIFFTL